MGTCKSRIRVIPVYVSLDGRIVETHELFPQKSILPRFNERYKLHYLRYELEPPYIIVRYPGKLQENGQPHFNSSLLIDHEMTFKEGNHLQITFRPREYGPHRTSYFNNFEWYPDLHYLIIKLITY